MKKALISNPPYNMKWEIPSFAQIQSRFAEYDVPPKSNANYAFVLSGLEKSDRCIFLLPHSVLSGSLKEEEVIRASLVKKNLVEAVILCPDNMFESTSIGTCLIILDKHKETATTEMVDLRSRGTEELRVQNGQYGGNSHEKRAYKKKCNVLTDSVMDETLKAINGRKDISGFCKKVSIEDMAAADYVLSPSRYIETPDFKTQHRSYMEITKDINRVICEKNACKLTINETLAKTLGFDLNLYGQDQQNQGLNELLVMIGCDKLEKSNYFATSKNKNEIKFENASKEILSSILIMIMQNWKQHIYYLNQEENRYLAELRDALLPDLMSGEIDISGIGK